MSDMKELLRLLGELDDQLVTCMRCGMCQAVCPIYGQTGREADVARGKIALLEGLAHEMVKNPEGVQEKVNRCLLCGSCQANCPSGVKALDIFLKARTILTGYMGLPPVKKLIFRGMLTKPGLFNNLLSFASKFQGLFTSPVNDIVGSSCSKFLEPMLGERHLMLLAKTPLHKEVPSLDTKPGKSGLKVAFFPGCMADKIFPRIAHASLKVLKHHGVGVYMPEGQACCGIPALSSGDMQSYEKLVRLNLAAFAKGEFDYLVTPCATCTSTMKKIWPTMTKGFSEAEKKAVEALSAKVMDVNAFVVDKLGLTPPAPAGDAVEVTVHDPCHLKKSLGVSAQPRAVLSMNAHYKLKEMAGADTCCGCGGSFTLTHADMSAKIGQQKRDNIKNSGAQVVATGCPACMMQISDMLSRNGDRVSVKHPMELYAECLPD
ncbi:glycolate oxidase iron-sulfur subunit [Humidesulfovibrio mexicanus]|uniref:Glycolate oxidase iron-sulfur subunit n=1 Tax=Humidesulfovibrio mexicanus TaxID=147047 RepID=A0A238Z4J1_9BACT|nr:(Fe-S)-binding protein [Humidesulfovibrio mexicanus]SNR77794.1 glycolate oxidase iron-sulfur subunit [Humidesulfovibrio mexicanus]